MIKESELTTIYCTIGPNGSTPLVQKKLEKNVFHFSKPSENLPQNSINSGFESTLILTKIIIVEPKFIN